MVSDDHYPNAGFDLFFPNEERFFGVDCKFVNMNIKCEMRMFNEREGWTESVSYFMYPRSSISKTPLMLANSVGIIDSGYRGDIIGAFRNLRDGFYTVTKYSRLLQICAPDLRRIVVNIVNEDFFNKTARDKGGFGSTGK